MLPEPPRARQNGAAQTALGYAPEPSAPAIDIRRQSLDLIISARFPGMSEENLRIEFEDDAIIILGSCNGSSGRFYIPLPPLANVYETKWVFRDEVLQLSVPLKDPPSS